MADDCLFCRIVRQEIPVPLVYDDRPTASRSATSIRRRRCTFSSCRASTLRRSNETKDAPLLGKLSVAAAEIAKRKGSPSPDIAR